MAVMVGRVKGFKTDKFIPLPIGMNIPEEETQLIGGIRFIKPTIKPALEKRIAEREASILPNLIRPETMRPLETRPVEPIRPVESIKPAPIISRGITEPPRVTETTKITPIAKPETPPLIEQLGFRETPRVLPKQEIQEPMPLSGTFSPEELSLLRRLIKRETNGARVRK